VPGRLPSRRCDRAGAKIPLERIVAALSDGDGGKTAKAEAIDFLEDALAAGPKPVSEIQKLARAAGHTPKSIKSARAALGIKPTKAGFEGGWILSLSVAKGPSTSQGAHFHNGAPSTPEGPFAAKPAPGCDLRQTRSRPRCRIWRC
jgi:hypothetical protein